MSRVRVWRKEKDSVAYTRGEAFERCCAGLDGVGKRYLVGMDYFGNYFFSIMRVGSDLEAVFWTWLVGWR